MGQRGRNVDDVSLVQDRFNSIYDGFASDLSRTYRVAILHRAADQQLRLSVYDKENVGVVLLNLRSAILLAQGNHPEVVGVLIQVAARPIGTWCLFVEVPSFFRSIDFASDDQQ